MAELKIVQGNDFVLKVKVTKKVIGGSSAELLPLDEVDNLKVSLVSIKETVLDTSISPSEEGICYARVSGLPVGSYALQLTGKYKGHAIRSCERHIITIVNNNALSNVTPGEYEGEDSYNVDTTVVLFTGVAIDTIDEVKDGDMNAVTSNAVYDAIQAEKTSREAADALKADTSYVNTELAKKANASSLGAKADKSYVDAELAKKVGDGVLLTENDITSEAIKGRHLASNSVTTGKIAPGTILETDINSSSFDSSLSTSGKLADAKVVGDKIGDIASKILEKPTATGTQGQVLSLDAQGKTIWKDESGGGSGSNRVFVTVTLNEAQTSSEFLQGTTSKSASEIKELLANGTEVVVKWVYQYQATQDGTYYHTCENVYYGNDLTPYQWFGFEGIVVRFSSAQGEWGITLGQIVGNTIMISSNTFAEVASEVTSYATGDLTDLTTTSKTNLVSAINELDSEVGDIGEEFTRVDADVQEVANGDYGQPDYEALPLLCGQPPILFGAGTPQEAVVPTNWKQFLDGGYNWNGLPSAIGQVYINTSATSNGRYTAYQKADGTLAWLNF